MIVNVQGKNIVIRDEIANKYKKAYGITLNKTEVLMHIGLRNVTPHPEKLIETWTAQELSDFVNKILAEDIEDVVFKK